MRQRKELSESERTELLNRLTLTRKQAAGLIGVGETNLVTAINNGTLELPCIEIGTRKVIPTAAVKALLGIG